MTKTPFNKAQVVQHSQLYSHRFSTKNQRKSWPKDADPVNFTTHFLQPKVSFSSQQLRSFMWESRTRFMPNKNHMFLFHPYNKGEFHAKKKEKIMWRKVAKKPTFTHYFFSYPTSNLYPPPAATINHQHPWRRHHQTINSHLSPR